MFFDSLIKSTAHLLIFHQNLMTVKDPSSLTKSYFTEELWLGSPNSPLN